MGNQREIQQVSPTRNLGVAIPIHNQFVKTVTEILDQYTIGHFYTYIAVADLPTSFPNMDGDETILPASTSSRFIIQSGGKMWCGYDAFCEHIENIAKYLLDAHFFVGDEMDYIDEFKITKGQLHLERVHSGGWIPLDEFLQERFPDINTE